MKLPKLHIFERNTGASSHAQAITCVDERIGGGCENATGTACCQQSGFGFKNMNVTSLHFQGGDADHVACIVPDQIHGQPFDKKAGPLLDVLLIQRMEHGVASAVSGSTGALYWFFTVIGSVATERPLVNGSIRIAVERHAHVFQVVHHLGRFATHELNGILVTQPVGTLDGVVEMVVPVVLIHVAQRGSDPALCGDRVRSGREYFGENCYVQTCAGQLERGTHTGAAGPDDNNVEFALGEFGCCSHDESLSLCNQVGSKAMAKRLRSATGLEYPSLCTPAARRW